MTHHLATKVVIFVRVGNENFDRLSYRIHAKSTSSSRYAALSTATEKVYYKSKNSTTFSVNLYLRSEQVAMSVKKRVWRKPDDYG